MSGVRALVAFRPSSKSRRKSGTPTPRPSDSKYSRKLGTSTFYEKLIPGDSAPPESTSGTRSNEQTMKAIQRSAADYGCLSLDRRRYRKNSLATRSASRRSWHCFPVSAGGRQTWNDHSTTQLDKLIGEEWLQSVSLSFDDETVKHSPVDLDSGCSNDESSKLSGFDGDSRSAERSLSLDVTGSSEDADNTSRIAPVSTRSSTSDLDFSDGHVVDGPASGPKVETVRGAGGKSDWRLQSSVKLKRYVGLSRTEAKDRRAVWAMKRSRTAGPVVQLDRVALSYEDDASTTSEEHSSAVTDAAVEPPTCSLACYQLDSCDQINSASHYNEELNECPFDQEATEFVSSVLANIETSEQMEGSAADCELHIPVTESMQLEQDGSASGGQAVEPQRRSAEMNLMVDERCDGISSTLVTDEHSAAVCDSLSKDVTTGMSPSTEDVTVADQQRSSVDVGAGPSSVRPDSDRMIVNSGTYRRKSHESEYDDCKSDPALVCSPGNVRHLRDLFERVASPSDVLTSPAAVQTYSLFDAAVHHPATRRLGSGDGRRKARQSTLSSSDNSFGMSSSSDHLSTSTSPEMHQHVSPNPVQQCDLRAVYSVPCNKAKSEVDLSSSCHDDDDADDTEMSRVRRTSSVDDLHTHQFCIFTCELNDDTVVLPRRTTSDPFRSHRARSHNDLLATVARDSRSVGQSESTTDIGLAEPVGVAACVSVIARHRPNLSQRRPRRKRPCRHTLTDQTDQQKALLKHRTFQEVTGMCHRLQTVEIARHRPKRCHQDEPS